MEFPGLQVSPEWRAEHAGAHVGALAVSLPAPAQATVGLDEARGQVEQALKRQFASREAIKEHPVIQAYIAYYKRFKKTYHVLQQAESVALKGRTIPKAPPLVQVMFMAELKNLILTAGHDRQALSGPVRLENSVGGESFMGMGGREQVVKPGDMFITDDAGIISDVIYGPDERSKLTPATTFALFTAYAPAGVPAELVETHLRDMESYVRLCAPAAQTNCLEVHAAD